MSTDYQGAAVSSPPINGASSGWEAAHSYTDLQFFNPFAEIGETQNRLPHWQQKGATYFVTFRLADSIPHRLLADWERERACWMRVHPAPWAADVELEYHNRFSGKIEHWLDAGYGSCILRRGDCATIVNETLAHFDGDRIARISSVLMPSHVHVLFVQNPEYELQRIIRSWKSYTTRQINSLLQRSGTFWQRDYFDRIVRNQEHLGNCVRYIRRNPNRATLLADEYVLFESEFAKQIE